MRVIEAAFERSATGPRAGEGWPDEGPAEIAFAGRSNVGKSTLLAGLMGRRGLVRISSTPGRTRLINFFQVVVDAQERLPLRLVDLPGFGYAKVSKAERAEWFSFVEQYLGHRAALRACVLLVDARRGLEPEELELARWLEERGVSVVPVLTKGDKLAKHERKPAAERARQILGRRPLLVSATTGEGIDALWRALVGALNPP